MKHKIRIHKLISLALCVTMIMPFISSATISSFAKKETTNESIATPTDAEEEKKSEVELLGTGNCHVKNNGRVQNGSTFTDSFSLDDGTTVYCGDHDKLSVPTGVYNSSVYTGNDNVRKVICYTLENDVDYVAAHIALHNAVHNDSRSLGVPILNAALAAYPGKLLTTSQASLSLTLAGNESGSKKLSADKATLIDGKQYKMTEIVTLKGNAENSITIKLPEGLYMQTGKVWYEGGSSVTINGGGKMRFAVPIEETKTYSLKNLTGKTGCDAYKITTMAGHQDLYYGRISKSSVSITITGEDIAGLKIRKRAQNSKDSMKGVKFQIYKVSGDGKGGGTLIATATVTDNKVSATGSYYKTSLSGVTDKAKELGVYIDKTGNEQILKCPVGWYRISEDADTVPEGYILHDDVWKQVVERGSTYTVHVVNKKDTGGIAELTKKVAVVGDEYSAEGLKYTVYKVASGDAQVSTGTKIADAVIDAKGEAVFTLTENAKALDISLSDDKKTLEDMPYSWYAAVEDEKSAASLNLSVSKTQYKELSAANRELSFSFTDSVKPIVISVKKTSASKGTSCTFDIDNNMYSLAGAEFTVYEDVACTKVAKSYTVDSRGYINGIRDKSVLVTDENGDTGNLYFIPAKKVGTKYYIKETKAPKGYKLSDEKKEIYLHPTEQAKNNLTFTDEPIADPGSVEVYKQDAVTREAAQGGGSLAGAEFTIKYYDRIYNTADELPSTAKRTWVLVTDESGSAWIDVESCIKEGSDELYYDKDGKIVIPLGTITIEETKAPVGYTLEGATFTAVSDNEKVDLSSGIYITQVRENENVGYMKNGNSYIISDKVARGDLKFRKVDEEGNGLNGIAFEIKNSAGDKVTVWTDSEGYYSTSSDFAPHSKNTNQGTVGDGIWFGEASVDDSLGALVYDTYTITELRCDANKETYKSAEPITVTITEKDNDKELDLGDIKNYRFPTIRTTAKDSVSLNNHSSVASSVTIIDTVDMSNLDVGHKYKLTGIIMDKTTGKELLISGKSATAAGNFTATSEHMSYDMSFTFNSEKLAGKDIVVFEYLYDESYPDEIIARHEDINDEGQTIHFVKIKTTATDTYTGSHQVAVSNSVSITDKVQYVNLVVGKEYTVKGTLYRKDTGKAVTTSDGKKITAQTTFIAESKNGYVNVVFNFDAVDCDLAGSDTVVFESLYYEGVEIATHADINDKGQTIHFPDTPNTPKTGDTMNIFIPMLIVFISFAGAFMLIRLRKKIK